MKTLRHSGRSWNFLAAIGILTRTLHFKCRIETKLGFGQKEALHGIFVEYMDKRTAASFS